MVKKEVTWKQKLNKLFQLSTPQPSQPCDQKPSALDVFVNQVVDSAIVGGIAGFSAYVAAGENAVVKVFLVAFGLAFLVKMKEYRKL